MWNLPFSAGAFRHTEYKVQDGNVSPKTVIYVCTGGPDFYFPFNFDDDKNLDKLIHEILHLIKGYGKLKVEDNHIIDHSGLIKSFYSVNGDEITFENRENYGIEEALNCVEASQILELMIGRKQELRGYTDASEIMVIILENEDFMQAIRYSQFSGDGSWIHFFGEEQSKILIDNFDIIVLSHFASFKILNTPEKRRQFSEYKRNASLALDKFIDDHIDNKNY